MPTQRRYPLKTKEAKQILEETSKTLKLDMETLFGKSTVEVVESDVGEVYLIGAKPLLYKAGDKILPTLHFTELPLKHQKSWLTWALFHMFARAQLLWLQA